MDHQKPGRPSTKPGRRPSGRSNAGPPFRVERNVARASRSEQVELLRRRLRSGAPTPGPTSRPCRRRRPAAPPTVRGRDDLEVEPAAGRSRRAAGRAPPWAREVVPVHRQHPVGRAGDPRPSGPLSVLTTRTRTVSPAAASTGWAGAAGDGPPAVVDVQPRRCSAWPALAARWLRRRATPNSPRRTCSCETWWEWYQ